MVQILGDLGHDVRSQCHDLVLRDVRQICVHQVSSNQS